MGHFSFAERKKKKCANSMVSRKYVLAALLWLAGCAGVVELEDLGSKSDSSWMGSDSSPTVLVVGYAYDGEKRASFERLMVLALRSRGISAEASVGRMPDLRSITGAVLRDYLEASPDGAILVARALLVTQNRSRRVDKESITAVFENSTVRWEMSMGAQLEATLFVHGRQSAVWTERSQLRARGAIGTKALGAYANRLLNGMTREGVVDRLR